MRASVRSSTKFSGLFSRRVASLQSWQGKLPAFESFTSKALLNFGGNHDGALGLHLALYSLKLLSILEFPAFIS